MKNLPRTDAIRTQERELFEKMYRFEVERKNSLNSRLGIPISILTLVFGVIAYYLRNLSNLGLDVWSVLFCIFFVGTLCFVVLTIISLIRAFYNYAYAYLPRPSQISADVEEIKKYYEHPYFKNCKEQEIERLIEDDVSFLIGELYSECSEINITRNDAKSRHLHRANTMLIGIIICLFLSSLPFHKKYYSHPRIQKIEIVNSREEVIKMSNGENQNTQEPKSPPSEPAPPKPEKKSEIRVIKEAEEKPPKQD